MIFNKQPVSYLTANNLLPRVKSDYCHGHSIETAIIKIYDYMVNATVNGEIALLCLLDLSMAFNSVDDNSSSENASKQSYGLKAAAFSWLWSYLTDRT